MFFNMLNKYNYHIYIITLYINKQGFLPHIKTKTKKCNIINYVRFCKFGIKLSIFKIFSFFLAFSLQLYSLKMTKLRVYRNYHIFTGKNEKVKKYCSKMGKLKKSFCKTILLCPYVYLKRLHAFILFLSILFL